jgi:flagellar biosynthesis protein FlhF
VNLKTYTAKSMPDALAMVRGDLGADAVILHTRSYKRGGVFGFGGQTVVEVTAGDGRTIGRQRKLAAERERAKRLADGVTMSPRLAAGKAGPGVGIGSANPGSDAAAGDLIRRTYAAARAELERSQPVVTAPAGAASPAVTMSPPIATDAQQLAAEMQAVKRMVAQMMRQQQQRAARSPRQGLPDKLVDQYLSLLQQEVAEELADEIVDLVRSDLPDAAAREDEAACRKAVGSALASLLPTDPMAGKLQRTPDGRPRTIALVGPTGVGKTTTVAKLAATFKLKQNKRIGLITIDTYRIAAVDQLRTYAGIIGVPLQVVLSPEEMRQSLDRCGDCDAILIDTAGRSQRDDARLTELSRFLAAAEPHEVHLVLSSTCSQPVLMEAVERFSAIRTDSIIFTKLDEAVSFGVLLNVLRKVNKKLSYVTTGQEVPHQIEPGDSARLAALVMGEGVV